jgi:hypothetical protein
MSGPAGKRVSEMTDDEVRELAGARRSHDTGWQRRCVSMLTRLLDHAESRSLPAISWTVTGGAPQLMGRCDGHPEARRPGDFQAWKAALTALAGPPDDARQRTNPRSGQALAYAIWRDYDGVQVNLGAEWPASDSEEG